MGIIIPEDFWQLSMIWTLAGNLKEKVSTLGFQPADPTETDIASVADDWYSRLVGTGDMIAPGNMFDEWTFQGVSVIKQTSTGPLVAQHLDPVVGTLTGMGIPSNSSWLIKKNTALGGRHNRGRMYIPPYGLASANVETNGNINSTLVGIMQDFWDAILTAVGVSSWELFVLHSDSTTPTPINGFSVENQVATQRRRLR